MVVIITTRAENVNIYFENNSKKLFLRGIFRYFRNGSPEGLVSAPHFPKFPFTNNDELARQNVTKNFYFFRKIFFGGMFPAKKSSLFAPRNEKKLLQFGKSRSIMAAKG